MLEKIAAYITKCFEDAFRSEQRTISAGDYYAAFILLTEPNGEVSLLPFFWCKYQRVLTRARFRIENNLKKNFGIPYNDYFNCYAPGATGRFGEIADPNHVVAMIEVRGKKKALCMPMANHTTIPYAEIPDKMAADHAPFWDGMTFERYKELYVDTYGSWPTRKFESTKGIKILAE